MKKTVSTGKAQADSLDALVKQLRRLGVRRYRHGALEVEFWAPVGPKASVKYNPKDMKQTLAALGLANDPADKCACGHSLSNEHNDCGCLLGCDTAVCASTETDATKES